MRRRFATATAACVIVFGTCLFTSANAQVANSDQVTDQAINLLREGKLQEAVDLQEQVIKAQPKTWLPHAALSYMYWQQGNAPDAIIEGQKAVRYAPHNAIALINLAHMHQALDSYPEAIPLYERAAQADPHNWVPPVCLSRCYAKSHQSEKALQILNDMAKQSGESFSWYFQLGNAYLIMDKQDLAIAPFTTAVSLAATPTEKNASSSRLYLALLRDNQIAKARPMQEQIFSDFRPDDSELYARTAAQLLRSTEPESGQQLLKYALENLRATNDSDGFFRLGKIFQQKAIEVSIDSKQRQSWLDNAEAAFEQAIELNPGQAKYHLALAAVLSQKGKAQETGNELREASSFNRFDPLAPYLIANLTDSNPALPNLIAVSFGINGLTCGCHITKIAEGFTKIKAVVFADLSALKPYSGTILVDESLMPLKEVFEKCPQLAFGSADALKEPITFEVKSQEKVTSLDAAVRIALNAKDGDVLKYPKPFDLLPPVMPDSLATTAAK
jgi:tetratricopeptide (TPR) repeat protein